MARSTTDPIDRILARCTETEQGCWEFGGSRCAGYGQVRVREHGEYVTRYTHRITYEFFIGEIPDGLVLDHRVCENRPCCNPWHLDPTTLEENARRGTARELCKKGLHPLAGMGAGRCRPCRNEWRRNYWREGRAA